MPNTYSVLAQLVPAATTLTTLYTVPASTQVVISSIKATNNSATPTTIRLSIAVAGAADDPKQYIAYDMVIGANVTLEFKNITLGAADVIRCYTTLATVVFSAFGVKMT